MTHLRWAVAVSMVAAAVAASGAKRTELLRIRPGMTLYDDVPLAYEDSFGVENENVDGKDVCGDDLFGGV